MHVVQVVQYWREPIPSWSLIGSRLAARSTVTTSAAAAAYALSGRSSDESDLTSTFAILLRTCMPRTRLYTAVTFCGMQLEVNEDPRRYLVAEPVSVGNLD